MSLYMTKSEPTTVLCHIIVFCWCCRYCPKLNFYVKSFALITTHEENSKRFQTYVKTGISHSCLSEFRNDSIFFSREKNFVKSQRENTRSSDVHGQKPDKLPTILCSLLRKQIGFRVLCVTAEAYSEPSRTSKRRFFQKQLMAESR